MKFYIKLFNIIIKSKFLLNMTAASIQALDLRIKLMEEKLQMAQKNVDDTKMAMDAGWLMLSGVVVFLMNIGFALLESGSVRFKNY